MHGNVRLLVCVECGCTAPLTPALARQLKAQQPVPCARCNHEAMRFKVMMYEDAESELAWWSISLMRGRATTLPKPTPLCAAHPAPCSLITACLCPRFCQARPSLPRR